MRCIGTSATMAGGGTREERAGEVSAIASRLFGDPVPAENVIGETLRRAITRPAPTTDELRAALQQPAEYQGDFAVLSLHPLASWAETAFGLATDEQGRLERLQPVSTTQAAERLAARTGVDVETCRTHLEALLLAGYRATNPQTGFPLFAFRLHQFISSAHKSYCQGLCQRGRTVLLAWLNQDPMEPWQRSRLALTPRHSSLCATLAGTCAGHCLNVDTVTRSRSLGAQRVRHPTHGECRCRIR
jgi:hypothetical protein